MDVLYLIGLASGLSGLGVSGRAVNISSVWFLPQEGFPVFYRYFSDKVTWSEAEAVCSFHHADLLSVQSSSQMDAARAYLKEIDVTDNIWIGLQRESPEKPFSWTNREKLLGDGYWTEPIPKTNEKLCAAIDPVADFRWNSFYCRGPQLASFVCELPVPEWAKKENGCLITSLPSLTVTLLPEVGVIQLLSDCGLEGTRRIACNGGLNREEIIKRLSCDVDAFASTIFGRSTTADTVRDVQHSFWSDPSNQINRLGTTKTFTSHTRHRRSTGSMVGNTMNTPFQEGTSSPVRDEKETSTPALGVSLHDFPRSPHPSLARNAPSHRKPLIGESKPPAGKELFPSTEISSTESQSSFKDLPVLVITGEKSNEVVSSATSESPPIVLMIENKDSNEPFLVPLPDDVFVDPSSPVEVVNVDLIEVDNLTANATNIQTAVVAAREPQTVLHPLKLAEAKVGHPNSLTTSKPDAENATEESFDVNAVEEDRGVDVPQRPNRGRLLTHSSQKSFYPRFLNRVLG